MKNVEYSEYIRHRVKWFRRIFIMDLLPFSTGDRVGLNIEWELRFRNMQRHCGEHMLSGTMDTLFGGINKGFHMGDEYITIDIDLGGRMLTDEERGGGNAQPYLDGEKIYLGLQAYMRRSGLGEIVTSER